MVPLGSHYETWDVDLKTCFESSGKKGFLSIRNAYVILYKYYLSKVYQSNIYTCLIVSSKTQKKS